ncbi:GH92 family glycosyl hydrolase (plasmid) [Hymenobacter tibetensis]|uniref:GH92 family glycosyl hydrolase n=1 Tax=Hymenobacter tibetensis TaxID=497967 RepID=A0ABY4D4S0_9BACT|nr:GH92 family glycosyl hydrolase [Hymenobacter tibetensis]UOG77523.1 GH92 family glycosyl hydrolase [Hymenobacter tibetensis]
MIKLKSYLIFLLAWCAFSCAKTTTPNGTNPASSHSALGGHLQYANPFMGTAPFNDPKTIGYAPPKDWRGVWAGLVFPGSSLPNAMVQLSPITEFHTGAGYDYEDSVIYAFAHTNKGHWNLCHLPVLPVTGTATTAAGYSSRFAKATEKASPGFYGVTLQKYEVQVELTSTLRCGFHRYRYRQPEDRRIVFKLGQSNERVSNWNIEKAGEAAVQGFQETGRQTVYFYGVLSENLQDLDVQGKGTKDGLAVLRLPAGGNKPVELRMGISFVSVENAKQNVEQEIGSRSFEQVRQQAEKAWENLLSKVEVKGGTAKQKQLFYSCLYRSFLWPALRSDLNGEYRDVKGNVVKADFSYYTEPSLWDTYRNKDLLIGMLTPQVTTDIIKSMQDVGHKTGFLPTFFHGDHASALIVGSYQRGITNFDVKDAYQLMLRNANLEGGARPHIAEYIQKGYISTTEVSNPEVETKDKAGVSKTLEYAFDDYAVAQLAKILNDTTTYRVMMTRSKNYKNLFDPGTKFMRGRLADGSWVKPFDPQYPYYEYMYREANAWQVSFFAPHDMPGLVALYGGPQPFEAKLDSLFTVPWNPSHIARNVSGFIGQYCHGNQPDHETPFSYYFIGKPEKSQRRLDEIMDRFYGMGKDGLGYSGMDDAGEMSAWYVFSSTGLYPYSAADAKYLVSVPLFDEVSWKADNGTVFTVKKAGNGRTLKTIKVNGKTTQGYFVDHALFRTGGRLEVSTN